MNLGREQSTAEEGTAGAKSGYVPLVCVRFSHVLLFAILWTIACQAPLSMGFSRQEHWSGLPCPPPGDLPDPGMEPASLMSPALAGRFFTTSATWEAPKIRIQGSKKKKIRKHLMSFPPSSQGGSYNQMPNLTVGLKECWVPY